MRIDPAVAAIMAVGLAAQEPKAEPYEPRLVVVLDMA